VPAAKLYTPGGAALTRETQRSDHDSITRGGKKVTAQGSAQSRIEERSKGPLRGDSSS